MSTKGDIVRYDSERERYAIGSTNQVLSVTAGLPAWKTLTLADSVLTTAGDVLYENNTPELARLPKGSDADVLTLASGLPTWATPSGGATVTKQNVVMGATFDTSSASFVDVTGVTVTLATRTSLMAFVTCDFVCNITSSNNRAHFQLLVDGVATGISSFWFDDSTDHTTQGNFCSSISAVADSGEIVKLQAHTTGAPNVYFFGSTAGYGTQISALEVS